MSLVIDLQKEAINPEIDVLSLLRKAYLVARKLGLKEFEAWLYGELNGYDNYDSIPDYREIKGSLKGWNPYHGWITVVIPDMKLEDTICVRKLNEAVSDLQHTVKQSKSNTISYSFTGEMVVKLSEMTGHSSEYQLKFPISTILNVIEQVRNRVLEWALLLEENNVIGEDMLFSIEEKQAAQNSAQIVNYISNFYGNIKDSQIQQGTEESIQNK